MTRLESGIKAIREVIPIIMGVAIANIVTATVSLQFGKTAIAPVKLPFAVPSKHGLFALGIMLTLLAVRFYHGNVRALDEEAAPSPFLEALGLLVLVVEGSIFAAFGLLLEHPEALWGTLFILSFLDLLFFCVERAVASGLSRHKRNWFLLNLVTLCAMCAQYFLFLPYTRMLVAIFLIATVLDYSVNWQFYFPVQETQ